MKNFLFLSPNFPPNWRNFAAALKHNGVRVLGLGDSDFASFPQELRSSLDWYYRVGNMHDYGELVRACGWLTHNFGKLDRVESFNEYWLETEAALRTDFNVHPGFTSGDIRFARRKSGQKDFFAAHGIPHARGGRCRNLAEGLAVAAGIGYPLIAKPDDGIGAEGVAKVHSEDELRAFFSGKPQCDFMVEEFIEADIITFDGLAGPQGELLFFTSHEYDRGVMETVQKAMHIYYFSLRDIPPALEAFGRRVVEAYGIKERFFHFEFFRKPDGSFTVMEVNMRPPGGMTMDMFNFACDMDLYNVYAAMVARGESRLTYERKYHTAFASRRWGLPYKNTQQAVEAALGPALMWHGPMPEAFAGAMANYGYIIRHQNLPDLKAGLAVIQDLQ